MTRTYEIGTDPARRLVAIRFAAEFWSIDVADRFGAEVAAAVASLHCPPGTHVVLVDLQNATIQSQEVIARMQRLIGGATAARIALVASAPLARMQTKRLQIRDSVAMFADLAEARAWLLGADRTAAA